ncbi:hypothetical protein [Microcoleus sp.]|uniref:hypothetical protein n=1 Tax=Microcoleus sp. TaxID=44472 RepID=UPI003593C703
MRECDRILDLIAAVRNRVFHKNTFHKARDFLKNPVFLVRECDRQLFRMDASTSSIVVDTIDGGSNCSIVLKKSIFVVWEKGRASKVRYNSPPKNETETQGLRRASEVGSGLNRLQYLFRYSPGRAGGQKPSFFTKILRFSLQIG